MKLRDLRFGSVPAWPPVFGGPYGMGDRFAAGDFCTLKNAERFEDGVRVTIKCSDLESSGVMRWHGDMPSVEQVVVALRAHHGDDVATLGEIEIGVF
jgi:hypothetical protein